MSYASIAFPATPPTTFILPGISPRAACRTAGFVLKSAAIAGMLWLTLALPGLLHDDMPQNHPTSSLARR